MRRLLHFERSWIRKWRRQPCRGRLGDGVGGRGRKYYHAGKARRWRTHQSIGGALKKWRVAILPLIVWRSRIDTELDHVYQSIHEQFRWPGQLDSARVARQLALSGRVYQ